MASIVAFGGMVNPKFRTMRRALRCNACRCTYAVPVPVHAVSVRLFHVFSVAITFSLDALSPIDVLRACVSAHTPVAAKSKSTHKKSRHRNIFFFRGRP
jgi:hypothetical protein